MKILAESNVQDLNNFNCSKQIW